MRTPGDSGWHESLSLGRSGCFRSGREIGLGRGAELFKTPGMAKIVGSALVVEAAGGGCRVNVHAADRIAHGGVCVRRRVVRLSARRALLPAYTPDPRHS